MIELSDFDKVEIRAGTVIDVKDNLKDLRALYNLTVIIKKGKGS